MADPPVLYYDFNSPYAYLATERIDDLIPGAEWKPIAFAVVLRQTGRLEDSLKRDPAVIVADVSERIAQRGLPPLAPPDAWPIESWSLMPMRAALVAAQRGRVREFSHAAFRKSFVESRSLSELDTVLAAAQDADLDPDEVEAGIQRPEIKEQLKANTDEALERGVFGIPTVAIGDQLFWGDDHLEEAAAAAAR